MSYLQGAIMMKPHIDKAIQTLPDADALAVKTMYPKWEDLVKLGQVKADAGYKFTYNGDLYRCINPNPQFMENWVPGIATASLYTRIDEAHAGTKEDPIPYDGNMILEKGKYYSQNGVVYICTMNSINPLYDSLDRLVGLYVEVAA